MGESEQRQTTGAESVVRPEPQTAEGLSAEGEPGSTLELSLRRSHAAVSGGLDEATSLAASGAISKAGADAPRTPARNPELLSHQGADGRGGGYQRQSQNPAAPRTWLQKPALPAA